MSDTVHLGSGKVRELYALGDDRLLLVASDRISTFDVSEGNTSALGAPARPSVAPRVVT